MKFAVRFHPRFVLVREKPNTLGIFGEGELELTEASLILRYRKRRPFWFSKSEAQSFPRDGVMNVVRTGKEVFFQPQRGAQTVRVWLSSPELAQELAGALPAERTPEFSRQIDDHAAFIAQINGLGTTPVVTRALVALNVAAFAVMAAQGAGIMVSDVDVATRWGTNFGPLTMNGEWWRLASSTFIHFGLVHLLLNMWALWSGGHLIERLYGSRAFLVVYAFAGLAGSLASLAWNPLVNSAGASGAIFGLYGALLAFFVRDGHGIPAPIARSQSASALTFIAYSLVYGLSQQGIDNAAHIGGLVSGFVVGALLAQPLDAAVRRAHALRHLARAAAVGVALVCAVAYPVVRPSEAVKQDQRFLRDLDWIKAQEALVGAQYSSLLARGKAGTLSDEDLAKRLESEVILPWWEVQRRLSQDKVSPDSPVADMHDFVEKYARLQGDALQMTHDAVKRKDAQLMQRANAKFAEKDELVRERQRVNTRRP